MEKKFSNRRRRHRIITNNEFMVKKLYFLEGEGVMHVIGNPYILYAKNVREPELKVLKCISYE